MAHGAPAILGLLRGIEEARIEPERARGLIDAGAPWLLAQATGATSPRFPYWVAEDGPSPPSRVAWCYGDLGIAAVLLANGRDRWWDAGLEIARDVAQCPIEAAGVCDAGLCHGAAGAAHIFNRLFHLTGDPALRDTARVWCVEALRMRQPGAGVGGFYALVRDQDLNDQPLADPGLLNGAAGIGLALLAAITDHTLPITGPRHAHLRLAVMSPAGPSALEPDDASGVFVLRTPLRRSMRSIRGATV